MNKTTLFAVAAALTVGLGSTAIAGEGSPDLAVPNYGSRTNDPGGSIYPPNGDFERGSPAWQDQYSASPRLRERDTNTGQVIRQNNYEDQTGINGQ